MAFMSSYTYSIDAKKRILIPSKYREELGDTFYITRSLDDCLTIYPESEWNTFLNKLTELDDIEYDIAREYFMCYAMKCTTDSSGRILLEDKHLNHAKITKNVVFVGSLTTINIWSEDLWAERESSRNRAAIRQLMSSKRS